MSLKWQPCKNRYWKIYEAWHFLKAGNRSFPMVYGMSMEKFSFLLPPLRNPPCPENGHIPSVLLTKVKIVVGTCIVNRNVCTVLLLFTWYTIIFADL